MKTYSDNKNYLTSSKVNPFQQAISLLKQNQSILAKSQELSQKQAQIQKNSLERSQKILQQSKQSFIQSNKNNQSTQNLNSQEKKQDQYHSPKNNQLKFSYEKWLSQFQDNQKNKQASNAQVEKPQTPKQKSQNVNHELEDGYLKTYSNLQNQKNISKTDSMTNLLQQKKQEELKRQQILSERKNLSSTAQSFYNKKINNYSDMRDSVKSSKQLIINPQPNDQVSLNKSQSTTSKISSNFQEFQNKQKQQRTQNSAKHTSSTSKIQVNNLNSTISNFFSASKHSSKNNLVRQSLNYSQHKKEESSNRDIQKNEGSNSTNQSQQNIDKNNLLKIYESLQQTHSDFQKNKQQAQNSTPVNNKSQLNSFVTRVPQTMESHSSSNAFQNRKQKQEIYSDDVQPQQQQSHTYFMTNLEKYLKNNNSNYFCQIYKEHYIQSYQALSFCKMLSPIDPKVLESKKVYLKKRDTHKNKKTLIFDMDETLIHCNESLDHPADVILPIKFPHGEIIEAGINIRPYAIEILKEMSQHFEIVVFTASHSCYANRVLDYLDPREQYIHHRLFREHCVQSNEGIYIKDLRVFGDRNLEDLVIVDNACFSFVYHLDNGIPIIPFYDNKDDTELRDLIPYLKQLIKNDIKDCNRRTFKMYLYGLSQNYQDLVKVLFPNK